MNTAERAKELEEKKKTIITLLDTANKQHEELRRVRPTDFIKYDVERLQADEMIKHLKRGAYFKFGENSDLGSTQATVQFNS